MADSLEIVAVRLAGWNENVEEETDHHTEYRVETTVRRNLCEETIVTYSRYRHFAALHAELGASIQVLAGAATSIKLK